MRKNTLKKCLLVGVSTLFFFDGAFAAATGRLRQQMVEQTPQLDPDDPRQVALFKDRLRHKADHLRGGGKLTEAVDLVRMHQGGPDVGFTEYETDPDVALSREYNHGLITGDLAKRRLLARHVPSAVRAAHHRAHLLHDNVELDWNDLRRAFHLNQEAPDAALSGRITVGLENKKAAALWQTGQWQAILIVTNVVGRPGNKSVVCTVREGRGINGATPVLFSGLSSKGIKVGSLIGLTATNLADAPNNRHDVTIEGIQPLPVGTVKNVRGNFEVLGANPAAMAVTPES